MLLYSMNPSNSSEFSCNLRNISTDIQGSETIYPTDFGDPLKFSSSATMGFKFIIFCQISHQKLDGLL